MRGVPLKYSGLLELEYPFLEVYVSFLEIHRLAPDPVDSLVVELSPPYFTVHFFILEYKYLFIIFRLTIVFLPDQSEISFDQNQARGPFLSKFSTV